MPFAAYYGPKDLVGAAPLGAFFAWLVFFHPDALGHPDNLVPANPYATPAHLVPEWYFLWVYAILRSIPSKPLGVVAVAAAMGLLIALPFLVLFSFASIRPPVAAGAASCVDLWCSSLLLAMWAVSPPT